ncbi:MAG: hypothetical protein VB038_06605 [Methanobrevibacter sp.]|uniref:hypothetical protein n=1 Tax=Methanobrevibacter sp. TaxID=66852 RepID=UPI002B1FA712|nr:hypothetical protein [Methanobrevibacter sp.]MEA4957380.1 hypothetical protein [Methanobrevibacter sp.]
MPKLFVNGAEITFTVAFSPSKLTSIITESAKTKEVTKIPIPIIIIITTKIVISLFRSIKRPPYYFL